MMPKAILSGDLQPYPAYKPSYFEWLGDVPRHWKVQRLRTLVNITTGEKNTIDQQDYGKYPFFVRSQTVEKIDSWSFDGEAVLTAGDGVGVAKVFHYVNGKFDYHERVYKLSGFRTVKGKYFFHYFKAMLHFEVFQGTAKSTVDSLRLPMLQNFPVVIPPLSEQAGIVRYLDYVDGRIRRYISARKKLVKLLEEQKQALINRAVTRGLDPNVRLKPSGVEWLGDLPAHWVVRKLRYLIQGKLKYGANAAAEYANSDWPRYLRITDFDSDGKLRSDTFRSLPPEIAKNYLVQPGDLLLARSGATVGKAFLVSFNIGKACYAGYLILARPRRSLIKPEYLFAFTQSSGFIQWKDSTFVISTIQNISAEKYADLPVPSPPLPEQLQILQYLDKAMIDIDSSIDRTRRQIDLLGEYRIRLIADVVTGKLDIREAAEQLPDEIERLEQPV